LNIKNYRKKYGSFEDVEIGEEEMKGFQDKD